MGKLFFNIIGKLGIVLCVCLTIMACADDMAEQVNNESSKATVNLTFNTRANEGDIDANEGIKTLRIIVTDEAGTILYNQKESEHRSVPSENTGSEESVNEAQQIYTDYEKEMKRMAFRT